MISSIQLTQETKAKLLKIIATLQNERNSRVTFEDAILYLLKQTQTQSVSREILSSSYSGIIDLQQATSDLREGRYIER